MVFDNGNYFLKWNEFKENSSSTFKDLRNDKYFTNLTLVCDDYQEIEVHKVILSTSSTFFDQIIKKNKVSHPVIYMRGLNSGDLNPGFYVPWGGQHSKRGSGRIHAYC